MNQPPPSDYLAQIVAVATPIIVLILTGLGWIIRTRNERIHELEQKLREDRLTLYNQILEPFLMVFVTETILQRDKSLEGKTQQEIIEEKMFSLEYKRATLKLTLIGSDDVVRCYNNLMQSFYSQAESESSGEKIYRQISLLAEFLLQIRRGMGNEKTKLDKIEMLEATIKDIRQYRHLLP